MPLSSLPLELLNLIANKVPRLEDRKSLRRTCKLFGEAFKPHVLAEVTLNIHGNNLETGISLLQALVHEQEALKTGSVVISGLFKHIRTLYIDSLSPAYCPESDADFERKLRALHYTYEVENQVKSWVKAEPPSQEVCIAERKLHSLLKPALESLSCLTAIHWRWHWKDSQWSLNTIMECLGSDELRWNITEFTFGYYPSNVMDGPIPIPNLQKVHAFFITGVLYKGNLGQLVQHPIISNNPGLTTLCLSKDHRPEYYPVIPFDGRIPATILDLRLKGLRLASVEKIVSSHFTTLDLGNSRLESSDSWGSLWDMLFFQQIHLLNLAFCHQTRSDDMRKLLRYLRSYSGLESFSLKGPWWYEASWYDVHAVDFYDFVLPQHAESLVNLELRPEFESRWCLGVENINVVRQCKRLRSLWVKINHKGLEPDPFPELSSVDPPLQIHMLTHLLLEMVSSDLHEIEKLTVEPARSPALVHDHSDMMVGAAFRLEISRRLRASVESFASLYPSNEVFKWVRVYIQIVDERVKVVPKTRDSVNEIPETVEQKNLRKEITSKYAAWVLKKVSEVKKILF
ncbi:hypothetical protein GGU11DRAFT_752952 [Lentinula aff. detonsa]|uniref:F-box domain-containing protein n=1 Tax=Lentinula aff. detonsa TaxID=2804958 RepID=A0AA38KXT7_9AGAR|nr:hypothetical protein GGU10DRAFT_432633 [Lentinula aff. detonsa]KAJ3802362.1 hypothetical protein GGU11DRAFT_752952 [Lentinula aff. detonsa]